MPSEVTRFVVARSPQRAGGAPPLRPPVQVADWLVRRPAEVPEEDRLDTHLGRHLAGRSDVGGRAAALLRLDEWLAGRVNRPAPRALRTKVEALFDRRAPGPDDDPRPDDDPLRDVAGMLAQALVEVSVDGGDPEVQRLLYRITLVVGLVELLFALPGSISEAADVLWALRHRLVLLPRARFTPLKAALARKPGFADLYVVREEWNRYVAGEIAHLENVIAGEFRERVHTRTDEREVTFTEATERSTTTSLDVQTTTRFELDRDARTDTTLSAHVEGQVDTSGQYGPTKVDTHIGGSLDYSVEESKEQAVRQATETVARAVSEVEEKIREERVTRTLSRVEDRNTHRIENETGADVVGMYRWVDKVTRLQTFRYPHRFLLEFEVPEPAAYLRWREKRGQDSGFRTPEPIPLTVDGRPVAADNPVLVPTDISEDPQSPAYYLTLAARWHAIGITAPPQAEVVVSGWLTVPARDPSEDKSSHDVWVTPLGGSAGTGAGVEGEPIRVPDGYLADARWDGWVSAWDQDDTIKPGWNKTKEESVAYVPPAAFITVGDSQNAQADPANVLIPVGTRSAVSKLIGGDLGGRRTGTLPITVLAGNYGLMSVQVRVKCTRQPASLLTWQLDIYQKLRAAYFDLLRAHEEEAEARSVRAGVVIAGRSGAENRRVIREELKRQVVELLTGVRFQGFDHLEFDEDRRPHTKIGEARDDAAVIQFLEQVFEWENLTYVCYPYFWTAAGRWDELAGIESPDPEYARFLRAGSARVVVSARPGFASTVLHFLASGKPWHGKHAPVPGDPEYLSVAQEIQDQTSAPAGGEPVGDTWEVRLPTTLVWLDPNPVLPKANAEATLPEPTG